MYICIYICNIYIYIYIFIYIYMYIYQRKMDYNKLLKSARCLDLARA